MMFFAKQRQEKSRNLGAAHARVLALISVVGIMALVVAVFLNDRSSSDHTRQSARCVESPRLNDCGFRGSDSDFDEYATRGQDEPGLLRENAAANRDGYVGGVPVGAGITKTPAQGIEYGTQEHTRLQRIVHYVTTRELQTPRTSEPSYSGEWSSVSRFGAAKVSIPTARSSSSVDLSEGEQYILLSRGNVDSVANYSVEEIGELAKSEFYAQLQSRERPMLFIHGFNVTFEEAILKTAMLAFDLKRKGPAISFSWPSHGELSRYPADLTNKKRSVPQLVDFLAELSASGEVDLVVHGLGNELFAEALQQGYRVPSFNQIILAAPDLAKQIFATQIGQAILAQRPNGVTLYASNADKFLLASERIYWRAPRLGYIDDGIAVLAGMDSVDISRIEGGWLASLGLKHSDYGVALLSDMYAILEHGHQPEMRTHTRRSADGRYWVLNEVASGQGK